LLFLVFEKAHLVGQSAQRMLENGSMARETMSDFEKFARTIWAAPNSCELLAPE
jgi:hypothetical protein